MADSDVTMKAANLNPIIVILDIRVLLGIREISDIQYLKKFDSQKYSMFKNYSMLGLRVIIQFEFNSR